MNTTFKYPRCRRRRASADRADKLKNSPGVVVAERLQTVSIMASLTAGISGLELKTSMDNGASFQNIPLDENRRNCISGVAMMKFCVMKVIGIDGQGFSETIVRG
jgi:hypothetical protein